MSRPGTVPLPWYIAAWLVMLAGLAIGWAMRPLYESPADWVRLALLCLFVPSKIATLLCMPADDFRRLPWDRFLAYFAFPGMQPRQFLPEVKPEAATPRPTPGTLLLNFAVAAVLLWVVPRFIPLKWRLARIVVAYSGYIVFVLLFLMDLWVLVYRASGIGVTKLWDRPFSATSLADFWGNRWNRIFSGMLRETLFMPLARRAGTVVAMLVVFLYSGVLHENFSVATQSGYGGPTAYFIIQAVAVWAEGRWRWLRGSWTGWLWTMAVFAGPLPLLFQPAFLEAVAVQPLVGLCVPGVAPLE